MTANLLFVVLLIPLFGGGDNVVQGEILKLNLNAAASEGIWTASGKQDGRPISVPAMVPGGIYSDLSDAGNIFQSEIYYRYNDLETKWVGHTNWTFTRTFEASEELYAKEKISLICNGLDSVSKVFLNGILVGSSINMFARYIFDLKPALRVGANELRIEFESPVEYAQKLWDTSEYPILPACVPPEFQGECHVNYIRKMQASFSWDWGPSYPSSGIWKDIYVEAYNSAEIRDVMLFFNVNGPVPDETNATIWNVTARVYMDVQNFEEFGHVTFEASVQEDHIISSSLRKFKNGAIDLGVSIPGNQVRMWWPNGYGAQALYNFRITYTSLSGNEISVKNLRGGYRTIELIEEPIDINDDSKGLSFYFVVNGVRLYAKGTNSIPIHVMPEKATREMTEWLFLSSKEANFNMIRVWGGGIYEPDLFYDLADEHGILIWEDFMFAVNLYSTTEEFLSSVRAEVDYQVKRLQYRPSLAIWATNNENEAALADDWFGTNESYPLYARDYVTLYIETILEYVNELDPSRACLPSSPTNGKQTEAEGWLAEDPYSTIYGDVHFYNYKDDGWDYRHLLKTRFASEYGYQSWPHPETLRTVFVPEDWHWFSALMYNRQHHPGGQEEMRDHIQMHLPIPENINATEAFEPMLYMAQITQSMSVKVQTEFYRRLKGQLYENGEGQNAGALYWQLNDIWPGSSWASIEINGRWKMLHYYARNFFADVITSAYDLDNGDISIHVVSDLRRNFTGNMRVRLFHLDSMIPTLDMGVPVTIEAQDAQEVLLISADELAECQNSISICFLYITMPEAPDNFFFLNYPNDASFIQNPELEVTEITVSPDSKTFEIKLETSEIAPFVYLNLRSNDIHGWFSDNGFIMVEPRKSITFTSLETLSLAFFTENLSVMSLHDATV